MDELPKGWTELRLRDVVVKTLGGDWGKSADEAPPDFVEVAVVRGAEFRTWVAHRARMAPVRRIKPSSLESRELQEGDLVVEVSGGGPTQPVGRVLLVDADALRSTALPLVCTNFCRQVRLSAELFPRWFALGLRRLYAAGAMSAIQTNTTNLRNLNFEDFLDLDLPLPPLAEQKRIVGKLEELTRRSRRTKEALDAVPPLLDQLRQSILAAAFRGDLTASWRSGHPGEASAAARVERLRKRRESLGAASVTTTGEGAPVLPDLPEGWTWARLGELGRDPLAAVQTGPFGAQLHKDEFVPEGVPVIAVGNLTRTGFTRKGLYFVTAEKAHQLARYDVQAGDVLFARSGATLGKVCVAPEFVADWRMTGHILRLRLDDSVLMPDVAVFALRGAEIVTKQVQSGIRGMTRPGYNTALLERIWVPVPPRREQAEMVRRILAAFSRVDLLHDATRQCESDLQRCDQSILAKAFRGELVLQDQNDEPASALLGRIRAAQEYSARNLAGSRRRSQKAEVVVEVRDQRDGDDAPGHEVCPAPTRNVPKDISELDQEALLDQVFAALWTHGPQDKGDAVRMVAEHLRNDGFVDFKRLRSDGPLYAQILEAIKLSEKVGLLDRPRRGQVRAYKPDANTFTADDWRLALVASLGTEPTDREEAIRTAAEWARDNLGLEFSRLRSDGHIVEGLSSAINSGIRRGEITRHDTSRISRAAGNGQSPRPLDRDSGARSRGSRGTSEVRDV